MAEDAPKKNEQVDLSSLEGLTLGTAWSETKNTPSADRPRVGRFDRGPRQDRPFGDRPRSDKPRFDRPREGAPQAPQGQGRPPFRREGREGERHSRFRRDDNRPAPIQPPSLKVVFYPEEAPFKALTKAVKASKRTYELFEICRLILEKSDRHVAVVSQKPNEAGLVNPIFQSLEDGLLFLSEAEALAHAAKSAVEKYFTIESIEVEAPKGVFPVVHRCGISGELIGPPNYHRYNQLLNAHAAAKGLSLTAVQAKVESVKEPEIIAAWVESQKKQTRYSLKTTGENATPTVFDSIDEARSYLCANHKNELIKAHSQIRLSGKSIEKLPAGEIRRSIEAARALQNKFPLETANNLRGRLRRVGFTLYKRGPKGVSYISAVKRKFRVVGQTFVPEIQQVIDFIEKNANILDTDLPKQMLGITPPPSEKVPHTISTEEAPESEVKEAKPEAPVSTLTPEESAALSKLKQTLQWLTEEGYVIHFGNGKLFVPPARTANAPKTEEDEEEASPEATEGEVASPESKAEAPKDETPATDTPKSDTPGA